MNVDSAHKSHWAIAEVVFGVPFLMGIVVQSVIPFSLAQGLLRQVLIFLGIALIVTGLGVIVLARRTFGQYRQPTDPGHPTGEVIKSGVFSITRNPLYLACVILFLGIALILNTLWAFVALLLSIILCLYVLIIPEEQYLAAKFGQEYKEYIACVHRWLGRK